MVMWSPVHGEIFTTLRRVVGFIAIVVCKRLEAIKIAVSDESADAPDNYTPCARNCVLKHLLIDPNSLYDSIKWTVDNSKLLWDT